MEKSKFKFTKGNVSEGQLMKVAYGDLKKAFEHLEIGHVWKPGKKKVDLVNKALEELSLKKQLESKGLSEQEVKQELDKVEADKKAFLQQEVELERKRAEELKQRETEYAREVKLSKDKLESQLVKIQTQLNNQNTIPSRRTHLLKKLEQLQSMLDDGYFVDGLDEFDLASQQANAEALIASQRMRNEQYDKSSKNRQEKANEYLKRREALENKKSSSK